MDNLLNNKTSGDLNQFENELNELRSITENYQNLLSTLKASEAKYRFLTENSADIVWHLDKDLRFTYVSPADKKIRGYEFEEVIGLSIWDILTPEGKIILEKRFAEKDQNKVPKNQPTRYELPLICKNGSTMWCEVNVNPITDKSGEVTGFNGITRDITERKRFEEEIKSKNEKLKELNDNKDKFFSINLLITEADNLSKEEIKEFAMLLNNSLNNQFRLLEDLLSWARIQSGKMKFEPIILVALEETYNVLQMFKTNLKSKNIDTKINVGEDVTVFADKDMFYLLLRNLISNAIKFTNPGGLIEINASVEGENVVFEVKDNGIGIEEEDLEKLFKLNSHYSTEGTHNEAGTGLGLVLCKEITDRHKGKIWVESASGSGSSFMFTLPKNNS